MKREIELNSSIDVTAKRPRNVTSLENLSNELFYEVFDYLDACDIHKAFSKLNHRFQNLLSNSLLPLKISFDWDTQTTIEQRCRQIIVPNKDRIISLHFETEGIINTFFDYCIIDSSFIHLESVILNDISHSKLLVILFYLNSLPRLFSLTMILEEDYYYNLVDIYRLIFQLPYLKYNKLSAIDVEEPNVFIPMAINNKFSTITHLVISHPCNLEELTSILLHTPYLRYLNCERLVSMDVIYREYERLMLLHLKHISIDDCWLSFDDFEAFIKNISSQLHVLHINTYGPSVYLDANRWKRLIKNHMPCLRKFYFDHHIEEFDDELSQNYDVVNQFTSSFWIEKQWIFELETSWNEFTYSIRPYRKQWFHDYRDDSIVSYPNQNISLNAFKHTAISDRQPIDTHSIQHTPPIQFTLGSYILRTEDPSLIEDLKPWFAVIQFTYLDIQWKGFTISMLIEMLHLLPNLDSLRISSLPFVQLSTLPVEDSEMLLLVSISNKITKVKLEKIADMEQMHFLMDLCPRMQYLEIGCNTEADLVNIVRAIPIKSITHILYLECLCLCIANATDKMVENLDTMIYFERRFHINNKLQDYIIARRQNKIYLKWKLS